MPRLTLNEVDLLWWPSKLLQDEVRQLLIEHQFYKRATANLSKAWTEERRWIIAALKPALPLLPERYLQETCLETDPERWASIAVLDEAVELATSILAGAKTEPGLNQT